MNQIWEIGQKPSFGPNFGPFCPKFGPRIFFFMSFTSTRCCALVQAIVVCNFKEN